MSLNFITQRFTINANSALSVLNFDDNRKYLLIGCASVSLAPIIILFYEYNGTLENLDKLDGLKIYPNGYYEPNIIPNNIISLQNTTVNPALCFIIRA